MIMDHYRAKMPSYYNIIIIKSLAETTSIAYGKAALSERSCCEWFHMFKNGDIDVKNWERSKRPNV